MQNVLSSELDVADAAAGGTLNGYAVRQVDLSRLNLERKTLRNVTLTRVNLSSGRLQHATGQDLQFSESGLRGCDLSLTHVVRANFVNCELIELGCRGALLEEVGFYDSVMSNTRFERARLLRCRFQSAELYGAHFEQSFLSQCVFSDPKMGNASVSRCDFSQSMLIDVDLRGANLHAASFNGAILVRVDLRGANLVRADLRGVVMLGCATNPGDLDGARLE